jgi:CRP-like cAMP-binding protein
MPVDLVTQDPVTAPAPRRRRRAAAATAAGLLGEFSVADLARLRALARERRLDPGDCLYDQGAVAVASFLVTEGRARVLVRGAAVAEVQAGAMIGDVDVLGRRPHRARVVAATPMTVWRIDAADFDRLLLEAPTFARAMARDLSHRLRAVEQTSNAGR